MSDDIFDTPNVIKQRLAVLCGQLGTDGQPPALESLSTMPFSRWQAHQQPVALLTELCYLLIKLGDPTSLELSLRLSGVLHDIQRARGEAPQLARLYRGVAQLGLGINSPGIHNITVSAADDTLQAKDKILVEWALVSAALLNRNVADALKCAENWLAVAQALKLDEDILCARLVLTLLHLLAGEAEAAAAVLRLCDPHQFPAWIGAVHLFADCLNILGVKTLFDLPAPTAAIEPYPLLLRFEWLTSEALPENPSVWRFEHVCKLRRLCGDPNFTDGLSVEDIQRYAQAVAFWELRKPLHDLEQQLAIKADAHTRLQFTIERLLGPSALASIDAHQTDSESNRTREVIVWSMDLRNFSTLSEFRAPHEIFEFLNPVFKIIQEELEHIDGVIHEFAGDCVIAAFDTDRGISINQILFRSVRCLQRIRRLNLLAERLGLPMLQIGIGIAKGPVGTGYLGGLRRCHLALLGNMVNIATRLESLTKTLPGSIAVEKSCFEDETTFWRLPETINYTLRDMGEHQVKGVSEALHVFSASPLLPYWVDFTPMGYVASSEPGVVYLDTGNDLIPGIIDNHKLESQQYSSCEILHRQPELLLTHLRDIDPSQIELRVHENPDLDCAMAFYFACELLMQQQGTQPLREAALATLASYATQIDQGFIPHPERLIDSPYGIFMAHWHTTVKKHGFTNVNHRVLEAGIRVVDAALYLLERHGSDANPAMIFAEQPGWFPEERALLAEDQTCYQADLAQRSRTYEARIRYPDGRFSEPRIGIWLNNPQSVLFKLWARSDPKAPNGNGYDFMSVDWSKPGAGRFVISVTPESGYHLSGLGEALEAAEATKREELGQRRPVQPIRLPSDNSDPWYFGQGHGGTIIDAPHVGTVLTAEEVLRIHQKWGENGVL